MGTIVLILIFLFLILLIPAIIILVAYLAAQSRKKKQDALLANIATPEFYAAVRYNKGKVQNEIFKIKAFQGSGIIYIEDRKLVFEDTLGRNPYTFNLDTCNLKWENMNFANGALKWFSVEDEYCKYYFNIETGIFIFHTNSKKMTTLKVFEKLIEYQNLK